MDTQGIQAKGATRWGGLSGSTLKLIAVFSMLLDHFGAIVVYRILLTTNLSRENYNSWVIFYNLLRNIGRTAFPIFCFLLVEGFLHTRSRMKYGMHLFLFALVSEIPFDLAIHGGLSYSGQNVYFTLFIGLVVIFFMNKFKEARKNESLFILYLKYILVFIPGCVVAVLLRTDYDYRGILLIVILYLLCDNRVMAGIVGFISFAWEFFCFPAFILIQCYNGKRGIGGKYFFYLFYPIHLLFFYIVSVALGLVPK